MINRIDQTEVAQLKADAVLVDSFANVAKVEVYTTKEAPFVLLHQGGRILKIALDEAEFIDDQ